MIYHDLLYDIWELHKYISKIIRTPEFQRTFNISQANVPFDLLPVKSPSRGEHQIGTFILAAEIVSKNKNLSAKNATLILISALLHDTGNSPFSHLGEYFLRETTGYDGESFLEVVLNASQIEKILRKLKISAKDIIEIVTGKSKLLSPVVHGSMDCDNLDNVGRFNYHAKVGAEPFDALKIAAAFRFTGDSWILFGDGIFEETKKWQAARKKVYESVYSNPYLNCTAMLYRALEIAFLEGEIKRDFFFLNDSQAVQYLLTQCNSKTKYLIERLHARAWYDEVVGMEFTNPTPDFCEAVTGWRGRKEVADFLCKELGLKEEDVCVYAEIGRDKRRITLPFVNENGDRRHDDSDESPIYRLKVFVPPYVSTNRRKIVELMHEKYGDVQFFQNR